VTWGTPQALQLFVFHFQVRIHFLHKLNKYNTVKQMSHFEWFSLLIFVEQRHGLSDSKISSCVAVTFDVVVFQYRENFMRWISPHL